jgi:outer membrane protein OmpA-like peptidoglycan-associated protein
MSSRLSRAPRRAAAALVAAASLLTVCAVQDAGAQSLGDRLKKRAEEAAKRAAEARADQKATQATNAAMDKAENVVKCAASDKKCIDDAKKAGKQVETTSGATATSADNGGGGGGGGAPAEYAASGKVGVGVWVNYDFVPGTRPLFVDDFSADNVGDFPRRLELVDGNMEVAQLTDGSRMLRVTSWPGKLAIPLPEVLPERFTIEFDATPAYNSNYVIFKFADNASDDVRFRWNGDRGQGGVFGAKHQTLSTTSGTLKEGQAFRGRIMADGKYVKVYMNDSRIANVPNADIGRSNKIVIETAGKGDAPAFIGNISVMAGGKKLYDALAEKGRVATQGIYFDTGSDRLRPESSPTLKEIAAMLNDHADLKLTIEGHTDNAGAAASNMTLSQKRADAVKAALVSSYGVDGGRLTAKGFGQTKPAAPNTTPEGRQQNRRVELVKM